MNTANQDGKEVNFVIERDGMEQQFSVTPIEYESYTLGFNAAFDEKEEALLMY